jgi:tRNA threonylcarbamoyladenosine biosynthesis protein TsaB
MTQLLLAIDTSGSSGSIALARVTPGQGEVKILEVAPLTGGMFSAQLVPQIAALLQKHALNKRDLGAFAVVSGPGSFTGLRVGLAAVKALAEALQKPIVAISLLEAFARGAKARGRVLAALDAGRGDVYVGDYELREAGDPTACPEARLHGERLLSREELIAEARNPGMALKSVVTADAALAETLRASEIPVELIPHPDGGVVACLGWERLQRDETLRPDELEANYIRRTDAEIFSKPAR